MNLGFGIMPLVIGILREYFENYIYSQILLSIISAFSIVFAILSYLEDLKNNNSELENKTVDDWKNEMK